MLFEDFSTANPILFDIEIKKKYFELCTFLTIYDLSLWFLPMIGGDGVKPAIWASCEDDN